MLKNSLPLVSVVMPVYNSQKYLRQSIESILNQTYKNFEFIIIDDGSTDSSGQIIKEFAKKDKRIIFLENKNNLGICKSLKRGVNIAKGKYIVRMDSDDWSYPKRLLKQVNFLNKNPKVVIVGSNIKICDSNLNIINDRKYPKTNEEIRKKILKINPFAHPAVMYQKSSFLKAGGYRAQLFTVEDYDLYFRLGKLGEFANLNNYLLKLRTHKDSISNRLIVRQSWLNLYVKIKAIVKYNYKLNLTDVFNILLHLTSIILIPRFLKFKTYNFLRRFY